MFSIDYVILQFLEKVCVAKEGSSVDEIETFIQKYGTKSEVSLPRVIGNMHIHKYKPSSQSYIRSSSPRLHCFAEYSVHFTC